jgi:large subunit ribosomal protein L24
MQRLRKDDKVVVTAGKDKGKTGKVVRVIADSQRVVVEGVNMIIKHVKPTRENQRGGIERREAPLHLSNVMLADPQTGEPTRVRFQVLESGQKVRVAVKSGEQIDS